MICYVLCNIHTPIVYHYQSFSRKSIRKANRLFSKEKRIYRWFTVEGFNEMFGCRCKTCKDVFILSYGLKVVKEISNGYI